MILLAMTARLTGGSTGRAISRLSKDGILFAPVNRSVIRLSHDSTP